MSAEGTPQEKPSLIQGPLLALTRLVVRFPWTTLIIGGLVALAASVLSERRLGFRTSRDDLLNPRSECARLCREYLDEFGDEQDAVIVVEGTSPEQIVPVMADVARTVSLEEDHFHGILYAVDTSKLRAKGLHYLPLDELRNLEGFLDQLSPVLQGDWSMVSLGTMTHALAVQLSAASGYGGGQAGGYGGGQGPDPRAAYGAAGMQPGMMGPTGVSPTQAAAMPAAIQAQMGRLASGLLAALSGQYQSPWPELGPLGSSIETPPVMPLLSENGRMGFVLVRLGKDANATSFVRDSTSITVLRDLVARLRGAHPNTPIGLTGVPIIEHDEMDSSQRSMAEVSLISLFGVALLFVAGFGGWRHPLLAVISLSLGTVWAMAYITLFVGHLNILSSAFAVILIGQGIDFSMYYVAEYLELRRTMNSSGAALCTTVEKVGPGIATGAITTAVAFFMAGLTEFVGVAELGIIAGGGILLCWFAGLTVLPAMIQLTDTRWPNIRRSSPLDVRSWLEPLLFRPRLLLACTLVFTAVVGTGVLRLWYDHNLLHLQASGIESVELEQRLLGSREQDAYYAVSVADAPADVVARKERLLQLPLVKKVEEIASRIPPAEPAKQAAVARIRQRLASLPDRAPQLTVPQLSELGQLLSSLKALLTGPGGASGLSEQFDLLTAVFQRTSPAECYARVTDYQQRMAQELLDRLHVLAAAADPQPPQFKDFPAALTDRFVGRRGKHLLKVYCKGDVWDMATMEKFVTQLRSVDPKVTGSPLLAFEGSRQMKRSYEQAALFAFIIIVPVVFFDFRSLRHTLLALLPLGVGILLMFGLMGHLNVPLNPANMIVLPLILGIGIDAGVHVVHDYISQPNGQYRISASTASAVVINAVTNMAGFGSLMIASHRGLQSLGRVLTIGLSTCLFASLVMLPALLLCVSRHRSRRQAASSPAPEPPIVRRRVEPPHPASPPAPVAAGRPRADILMRQNSAAPRL